MEFCKDPLWNQTLTWDTDNPNLTECLRNTILPGIPCALLWFFTPLWLYRLRTYVSKLEPKSKEKQTKFWDRMTFLFCTKSFLTIILLLNVIGELVYRVNIANYHGEEVAPSDIFYTVILALTFVLTLLLLLFEKKQFVRSSPPVSLFWIVLLLVSIPTFKVDIEICHSDTSDVEKVILTATFFPVLIIILFLNVFADRKDLVPKKDQKLAPENKNSFLSTIVMAWLDPTIWQGYRHGPLTQDKLVNVPDKISVEKAVETFSKIWDKAYQEKMDTNSKKDVGLLWPLLKGFGLRLLWSNCIALIHYTIMFVGPQILKLLIQYVEQKDEVETWKGYFYAVLLFANQSFSTMVFQNYVNQLYTFSINVRNSLTSAIFRKSLKLSSKTRNEHTVGEITNYISVDAQRFLDTIPFICILWATPYQVGLAFVFLYIEMGPPALAGLIVLGILVPFNLFFSKFGEYLQNKQLKAKDERIKLMNEILAGMKVLKVYAWEIPFIKRLNEIRKKEIRTIRLNAVYWAVINFTFTASPVLISIAVFTTYTLTDPVNNILTPQKIFVAVSLFNMLRIPLTLFPMTTKEMIRLVVSTRRIRKFLNAEELQDGIIKKEVLDPKNTIEIDNANFSWEREGESNLKNININIPKRSLTAIVGTVGSGKSSLISAILGDMHKVSGDIRRVGSVAYVPQIAWIQNLSLRDNILFGKPLDSQKYTKVVDACALRPDFDILVGRDKTEIGENGINLSGGQKQRVSLARAVYSDADIILLDDPLSAVDAHVAKHLFQEVLNSETGLLKNTTRVLATHSISILPQMDHIIVMRNGRVGAQGTYEELMANDCTFAEFIREHSSQTKPEEETVESEPIIDKEPEKVKDNFDDTSEDDKGRLIDDETALTGRVNMAIYKYYASSIGYFVVLIVFFLYALEQGIRTGGNFWLRNWADENTQNVNLTNGDTTRYLGVYSALGLGGSVVQICMDLTFYLSCAQASKVIHEKLLYRIMRSPMWFFDTNPIGRIINRFSSDIDVVDGQLPFQFADFVWCLMETIAVISIIGYTTPLFLVIVIPLGFFYFLIQKLFIPSSRQLKRLYSISKSPVYSHFSETVSGAPSIRAYEVQHQFTTKSESLLEANNKPLYLNFTSYRWLGTRIESIGNCIIFFAEIFVIINRNNLTGGEAGLSISYSMSIYSILNWMMRMLSELENNCVAIERIAEYTNNPYEASWDQGAETPNEKWPNEGKIIMKDYQTRYREGLDPVLKGLSMNIQSGEKIGICGRTGAGKSSLTLALFRIIEPTAGQIIIDEHDICKLGLHPLRSKLTIIPQDPVLFSGDLRFNLDPTGEHSDAALWQSLELSHLKEHIEKNLEGGLNHIVSEGGGNFSVGQRQLICLARALLRKTKILILDEATAAVDLHTDQLIQATIKSEFADCTVITVAHRLKTILECDRIAVLADGKLKEIGKPSDLLEQPDSSLRAMAQDAGLM